MHLLHRSAKRLLLYRAYSIPFTGLPQVLLQAGNDGGMHEERSPQKIIINKFTRHFSVLADDHIHETSLKNQQEGCLLIDVYRDVSLPQRTISEERYCKGEGLEHGALELSGGATILNSVTHVDDCARMNVDDSVSMCVLASQKGYEKKGYSCNKGISELVVAEAGTISHINNEKRKQFDSITSELAETNCLLKQKEGNKHFDGSASELAISNPCKASCKDINKENHFDSSTQEETVQTTKFPSKGKQGHIVNDSTSDFFACDIKNMSRNPTGELMEKERFNLSVDNTETGLQRDDIGMFSGKDASGVCVSDTKTSFNKNAERTCGDLCGGASEKPESFTAEQPESFTAEQGLVSQPCERVYFSVQKKINKKKKKKKKKKSWNTNRQFGPEDLEHLSLTPHPAAAGQALCKEKMKMHRESFTDDHTCSPNFSLIQSKIISPDSVSRDVLKSNDKEKRESVDAIFADRRQVNQGITNGFVEENQKSSTCENSRKSRRDQGQRSGKGSKHMESVEQSSENSSKSRRDQGQRSGKGSKHMESVEQSSEGEEEVCKNQSWQMELMKNQDTEHMTGKIWRVWEKAPSSWQEDAYRPLLLAEKEQAHLIDLSHNEVIDKGSSSPTHLVRKWRSSHSTMKPLVCKENEAENEASDHLLGNRGKTIAQMQYKDGTSLDPPSSFWEQARTIEPVETIECGIQRAKWDLAGVQKVHYPLRNYRELYIILDLNGVLIKRWDKNPSLPGVCKLNKKWIQLRPGCIEFLQKAFSSFRVGIWSTMTQRNVLSMCNFLEEQAHQSLPFFMLWSKDSCYQHRGVQRPNKANVVADFKPLSRVWSYFKPYLGFHNTVLVDDSPYKACMNNPYNCIFPNAFEGYTDDKYLNDVLWPYLEKMRMSHNRQAYIANNPFGQPPVVVGHELYHHVHRVMDVFDYRARPLTRPA